MNPKKKKYFSTPGIITISFMLVLAVLAMIYRGTITDYLMAIGYEPTLEMSGIIEELQLSNYGKRVMMASRPEIQTADAFNENCPGYTDSATLGCYYAQRIYVYDVQNAELAGIKQAVTAHELLHAIWSRMSENQRQEISDDLRTVYRQNMAQLKAHMENYDKDEELDELHSVIGTEISPSLYTTDLKKHYSKFFTNLEKVHGYYAKYSEKFLAIQKRNDELNKLIKDNQAKLESDTDIYLAKYDQLNKDIDAFNEKNARGGFTSERDFYAERNILVARRNALQKDYDALIALTSQVNDYINEYNQNLTRSNQLYDSVNSHVEKPSKL